MISLLRVLRLLSHRWPDLLPVLLLALAAAGSNIGLLAVAAFLVASAAQHPALATLAFPMYLVRVLGVTRAFLRYAERLTAHRMNLQLLSELRLWFFSRLAPLAPARFLQYRGGDLLARLSGDVDEMENVFLRALAPSATALLCSVIVCAVFAAFSVSLAVAAALFLLAAAAGVPLLAGVLGRRVGNLQPALYAALSSQVVDTVQGMPDLLAFGRDSHYREQLDGLQQQQDGLQRRMALIGGVRAALDHSLQTLALLTILLLAIPLVRDGEIDGVYLAFLVLLMLASFEPLQPLGQAFQTIGRSAAAATRFFAVADEAPAVADPPRPRSMPVSVPTLCFERVTFSYRRGAAPALSAVSLVLPPGARMAIVGASGSGKSTVARLASRVWDPDSGAILLDGAPLSAYALESVRATVGVLTQDTYIFSDSLRNNLLIANPHASDADLLYAIEAVLLGELLDRLPAGLDGQLGEQGLRISGGERQRVAIARALLRESPVLVLDEATANLDPVTEDALLQNLFAVLGHRSLLAISHRLVHMDEMDHIMVLDHGSVVEQGTHDELLAAAGPYRQLFETQNQFLTFH